MASKYDATKQALNLKLEDLLPRLDKIRKDLRRESGALSADFAEQATELENAEVLEQLEVSLIKEVESIQHALKRIEQGSYGACESCGGDIGESRLEAIPFASQCMTCASAAG